MQRLQMNPRWGWRLISLINSYLSFSFFDFSKTNVIAIRCIFSVKKLEGSFCEKHVNGHADAHC